MKAAYMTKRVCSVRSAQGFSLAGWDEPNYVVQFWPPPLAVYRVLVLPANPPLRLDGHRHRKP